MARERSISLHDAGVQLAQLLHSKEKVASGKLLSLLKAGEIEAGFPIFRIDRMVDQDPNTLLGYSQHR